MRRTTNLSRLASTKCGMRKILKKQLAPVDYIKHAVQTGIYKGIYFPEKGGKVDNRHHRGRGQDGGNNNFDRMPKINPYPEEYEILTLNPPLPEKPRLSKKDRRYLEMELKLKESGKDNNSILPTERFVKSYMKRYDDRMRSASVLSDSEREDAYYRNILGVSQSSTSSPRIEDMNTAMGRKPAVLNHAYEFALKQYEVLSENDGLSEEESIQIVEDLLAKEEKDERLQSRIKAQKVVDEIRMKQKQDEEARGKKGDSSQANNPTSALSTKSMRPPSSTIPSILYSKPRTIQALHIWGKRLQAVPYNQWTLGATTALDHWIAVDVLGMKEETWNRLLDGELELDLQESRGEDVLIGDKARMNDIMTVRSTLFPETILHSIDDEDEVMNMQEEFGDAENALDDIDVEKEATVRSIDELLASLGGIDDEEEDADDEDNTEDIGIESSEYDDLDSRVAKMVDDLQEWRARNVEKPFEQWDNALKNDFNTWLSDYLALVTTESDGEVDIPATRDALLSEPPLTRESSQSFWSQVQDETNAEILLNDLLGKGSPQTSDNETEADRKAREALELFLTLPYERQLRQLVNLGTLQPILDEYYKESDRMKFMERYGEMLLEGMEVEHLVSDPEGHITLNDIGADFFSKKDKIDSDTKFSIKMIPYGTDEYGMTRSEKARMLYRAWNIHKAGRARYAESQFKKGKISLRDDDNV